MVTRRVPVVPVRPWAYCLVWEVLDSTTTVFGKQRSRTKRGLHFGYAALDTVLVFGSAYCGGVSYSELGAWFALYGAAALVFRRQFKYFQWPFHYMTHAAMLQMPTYDGRFPELTAAVWAQTLANALYMFKGVDAPEPRRYYAAMGLGLPFACVALNTLRFWGGGPGALDAFVPPLGVAWVAANAALVAGLKYEAASDVAVAGAR